MKHKTVLILRRLDETYAALGRITVTTIDALAPNQQQAVVQKLISAFESIGVDASPKLPEPHR